MTQRQLAAVSPSTLSRYFAGKRLTEPEYHQALAACLARYECRISDQELENLEVLRVRAQMASRALGVQIRYWRENARKLQAALERSEAKHEITVEELADTNTRLAGLHQELAAAFGVALAAESERDALRSQTRQQQHQLGQAGDYSRAIEQELAESRGEVERLLREVEVLQGQVRRLLESPEPAVRHTVPRRNTQADIVQDIPVVPLPALPPPTRKEPPADPPAPRGAFQRLRQLASGALGHGPDYRIGSGAVQVRVGWQPRPELQRPQELDLSALLLSPDSNGRLKVRSTDDFIYYNNLRSQDGAVVYTGRSAGAPLGGDALVISVDPAAVDTEVQEIQFVVSVYDAGNREQNFVQVANSYVRVVTGSGELARYELSADAGSETALLFGSLLRISEGWKFQAIGLGYASGLRSAAAECGVQLESLTPSTASPGSWVKDFEPERVISRR
ncbi:TerD family protein [Streptomyces sp. NPDC096934]|uniref:TerD family protein n=1 Tax=Streptomyces sp. NPDC096934 TaxID=3155551 RepID=UPI00331AF487